MYWSSKKEFVWIWITINYYFSHQSKLEYCSFGEAVVGSRLSKLKAKSENSKGKMQCMGKGETPGIDECLIWVGKVCQVLEKIV